MNKYSWIGILIVGIIPFIIAICYGVYSVLIGSSGLCIMDCFYNSGFEIFLDSIILYSYLYWPTYFVGVILICLAIIKLRKYGC